MKNKFQGINYVLLLILSFFLLCASSVNVTSSAEILPNSPNDSPILHSYTTHDPIYIDYDDNFTDYGFPGDGSIDDPYRIENYNITITDDYPILFSGNNTKHFVIQDCFLKTDTNIGIYLGKYYEMGSDTVNIVNNIIISENHNGIELLGGNHSIITGNTITADYYGIYMEYAYNSFVANNLIRSYNEDGIYLEDCPNSLISRNNCTAYYYGIYLYQSPYSTVSYNNCSNGDRGIYLDEFTEGSVTNNIIIGNFMGIETNFCYDTVFTNNLLQENDYAIFLNFNSDSNTIHHNAFIFNDFGGTSQAYDDGAGNFWFDTSIDEGNYWYNGTVASSPYYIDGSANSVDLYPLGVEPVISEFNFAMYSLLLLIYILFIPIIIKNKRKERRLK